MIEKEKAHELIDKFYRYVPADEECEHEYAVQCALIAVDEIINSFPTYPSEVDWDDCGATYERYFSEQMEQAEVFWKEVRQEIEKCKKPNKK